MKEYRDKLISKAVEAGKKAAFVAKNADADKMAGVREELRNANDANREEYKVRKAPGNQMTDAAFGRKAAEANQRYRDAAGIAIDNAYENTRGKKKGK